MSDAAQIPAGATGLTAKEAHARLDRFGPTEPTVQTHASVASAIWRVFRNPLVLILMIAAVASALVGQAADAIIIAVIVLLSSAIDFVQTRRSQQAVERLRDQVASTATVLRNGTWTEVKRREVVPGDIIRLSAGDLVPADAQLLSARDLYIRAGRAVGTEGTWPYITFEGRNRT